MKLNGKIVFVSILDFPFGLGNSMRIRLMAKTFAQLGYEPYLIIQYAPGTVSKGLNKESEGVFEGIHFKYANGTALPVRTFLDLLFQKTIGLFRVLRELYLLNKKSKISYLYLYGTHGTIFTEDLCYLVFAKIYKIKIIVDVNDSKTEGRPPRKGSTLLKYYLRQIKVLLIKVKGNLPVSEADVVIYVSDFLKKKIEMMVKPKAKCFYIPMLIDKDSTSGTTKFTPAKIKKIGYAGFFKEYEGLDFLIEALNHLRSSFSEFVCEAYGRTQSNKMMSESLQMYACELGLGDHFKIYDSVPFSELQEKLSGFDVLVMPRRENEITVAGFSQKFGDYFLSGRPVVSTRVGDISRIAHDNVHIFFSRNDDPEEFASRLLYALSNPEKSSVVGNNGRELAISLFDYRNAAERMKELANC